MVDTKKKIVNYLSAFEERDPLKFASRKDIWVGGIIWTLVLLFSLVLFQSIFISFSIIGVVSMVLMIGWLSLCWFRTEYTIEKDILIVKNGLLIKKINIQEIETVRYITNSCIAPALSRHKLEINYGNYGFIQISPKDRNAFIHELKKINTRIRMNY